MTNAPFTFIEVIAANEGAERFGLKDGQFLTILKETPKFFFVRSHAGREIKVSKHTKRACHWSNVKTSPVFNV